MNITASIALLSACPFVSLAAVPATFSETVLDAAGPKGSLKGTLLTPNSKTNRCCSYCSRIRADRSGWKTTRLV
ncbi:Uncharacterised protein [Kluyvera cryocrescens]|uniref:Uncharacterized protein n=1 Tax=Kluyvera cryocrescens TaxID=580 RepID=A0A485CE68_KLUCR|nr:Uncharacterised protein [Kluyvera cryocrescens]